MSTQAPISGAVLYVEDEETDALLMQMAFERSAPGSALHVVSDGKAAMDYLSGKGAYGDRNTYPLPALVLLDLNLPVLSGFDVLRWMRGPGNFAALPIVIFSSSARERDRETARDLGATDYVEKPTSIGRFSELVRSLRDRWLQVQG